MPNVHAAPLLAPVVDDRGTSDARDDVELTRVVAFRLEVYEDGVDVFDPSVRPVRVVRADGALTHDAELELAIQRLDGLPALDPSRVAHVEEGTRDATGRREPRTIVGYGDPDEEPPRLYATIEEAREATGRVFVFVTE